MADKQGEQLHKWKAIEGADSDAPSLCPTFRMRVPGGWLYRVREKGEESCMVFVPKPRSPFSV